MAALHLSGVMIFSGKTGVAMAIKHFSTFWVFQIFSVINNFPETVWKNTGTLKYQLFLMNRLFGV